MIWFFNLEKASAVSCDSYNDLFQYIRGLEKLDVLKRQLLLNQCPAHLDGPSHKERELIKQWCLEYCKNNNYIVVENTVPANNSSKAPQMSQKNLEQLLLTKAF